MDLDDGLYESHYCTLGHLKLVPLLLSTKTRMPQAIYQFNIEPSSHKFFTLVKV